MARIGPLQLSRAWRYALVGGLVSMPLSLGHYWLSGMGENFSTAMILVGGLIAGFLAERDPTEVDGVGVRAGAVGALPGLVWIAPAMLESAASFATAWSVPVVEILFVLVFSTIVVGFGALFGVIGAAVGGWLARKAGGRELPVPGTGGWSVAIAVPGPSSAPG